MGYFIVGIGGLGIGLVVRWLVDWMGRRRGHPVGPYSSEFNGPLVLFSAGLLVGLAFVLGGIVALGSNSIDLVRRGGLALVLYAAADADGRWGIVPNELVLAGVIGGLLLQGCRGVGTTHLWAALFVPVVLHFLREGSRFLSGRRGFGIGDVKLGAVLGLFLGWDAFWVLYLAAIGVSLFGVGRVLLADADWTRRLPFAPFVALGTGLHWFVLPFELVRRWIYL